MTSLKPSSAFVALAMQQGDRIADLGIGNILDAGDNEADLARRQLRHLDHRRRKDADLQRFKRAVGRHQLDLVTLPERAVKDAHEDDDPLILVVPGVEQQRLERRIGVSDRGRDLLDDLLKDLVRADPLLGAGQHGIMGIDADDLLDLLLDPFGIGSRQVDLVQHRKDLQVDIESEIDVGQCLGLDPLGGVHHQQAAFAGGQGA